MNELQKSRLKQVVAMLSQPVATNEHFDGRDYRYAYDTLRADVESARAILSVEIGKADIREVNKMNYDKPTYRQYDNPADQWQEWKNQANALGYDEARRHASVSTNNRHRCNDCFCCACLEYVLERNRKM